MPLQPIEAFEPGHPAIEVLNSALDTLWAAWLEMETELQDHVDELDRIENEYHEAASRVASKRRAIDNNQRRQAALRDAIEALTGPRPE